MAACLSCCAATGERGGLGPVWLSVWLTLLGCWCLINLNWLAPQWDIRSTFTYVLAVADSRSDPDVCSVLASMPVASGIAVPENSLCLCTTPPWMVGAFYMCCAMLCRAVLSRCVLANKSEAQLFKLGECPLDPGGYFIVRVSWLFGGAGGGGGEEVPQLPAGRLGSSCPVFLPDICALLASLRLVLAPPHTHTPPHTHLFFDQTSMYPISVDGLMLQTCSHYVACLPSPKTQGTVKVLLIQGQLSLPFPTFHTLHPSGLCVPCLLLPPQTQFLLPSPTPNTPLIHRAHSR